MGVGLVEVGEEAALRVVAAVHLVEEIDALEIDGVVGLADDVAVFLEFLNVDDGDFQLPVVVVDGLSGFDVSGEFQAGVDFMHLQATAAELAGGLDE